MQNIFNTRKNKISKLKIYRKNNTCGVSVPKRGQELPNTGTSNYNILVLIAGLFLVASFVVIRKEQN